MTTNLDQVSQHNCVRFLGLSLVALTVVTWIASVITTTGLIFRCSTAANTSNRAALLIHLGRIMIWYDSDSTSELGGFMHMNYQSEMLSTQILGRMSYKFGRYANDSTHRYFRISIPFPLILIVLIPSLFLWLERWRFTLRSMFAWVTLLFVVFALYAYFPAPY